MLPLAQSPQTTVFSRVLRLALPMAGSRFIQMLSGFLGMIMLAHLGHQVLAASALMTSTTITVVILLISILFSMSVVVGQTWGAGKHDEIGVIIQEGAVLALLLSIPAIIALWYIDRLLLWTGQLPALVFYVREYFHALVWAIPGFMLLAALQQTCYGMLKQRLVIILNCVCLLIFIPSAYVLIFGKLGCQAHGVAGLAYAFAIQSGCNIVFLILSFYFIEDFKPLNIFVRHHHKGWRYLRQLFHIGWPMSAQFGGELISFFVISVMIGWLGPQSLAASQITFQVLLLFLVPIFAIAEATGILISQSVGAKQHHEIRHVWRVCIGLTLGMMAIFAFIFLLFPKILISFYIDVHNPASVPIVHLAKELFVIIVFSLSFDSVRNVASGALRGLYDTRFAMIVGILVMWVVSLPIGYLLAFPLHFGVIGFQLGMTLATFVGAGSVWWWWNVKLARLG